MENLKNKIISLLQEDARYTTADLAVMTGESEKTVKETVSALEDAGAIVKYSAIINSEVLESDGVEALIEVKVVPQKLVGFDAFAEELYNFNEVKSLYLMSGSFDLAIMVAGKNITEVAKFVSEKLGVIDGIVSVATHFILKKYKVEGQVCKKQTIERQCIL
jgi:DNA-binding Lrp family transcriptional regulator